MDAWGQASLPGFLAAVRTGKNRGGDSTARYGRLGTSVPAWFSGGCKNGKEPMGG